MARRFGSAMMANEDSTPAYILSKAYACQGTCAGATEEAPWARVSSGSAYGQTAAPDTVIDVPFAHWSSQVAALSHARLQILARSARCRSNRRRIAARPRSPRTNVQLGASVAYDGGVPAGGERAVAGRFALGGARVAAGPDAGRGGTTGLATDAGVAIVALPAAAPVRAARSGRIDRNVRAARVQRLRSSKRIDPLQASATTAAAASAIAAASHSDGALSPTRFDQPLPLRARAVDQLARSGSARSTDRTSGSLRRDLRADALRAPPRRDRSAPRASTDRRPAGRAPRPRRRGRRVRRARPARGA